MSDHFFDELVREDDEPGEPTPPTRRAQVRHIEREVTKRKKRKKRGKVFGFLVVAAVLAAVAFGALVVWPRVQRATAAPEDYPGPGSGVVQVSIATGDTGTAMGHTLVDAGVVKSVGAFQEAFEANPRSSSIRPGTYELKSQMKASDAVVALLDTNNLVFSGIQVIEGTTVKSVFKKASESTGLASADFDAIRADPSVVGLPAEAGNDLEGWLAPGEYPFDQGESAVDLVSRMVANRVEELTQSGIPQDQWERMIVIASIAVREVNTSEDRSKVSQAIANRLAIDMKLQMDSTGAYGAEKNALEMTQEEIRSPDNPYSTYAHYGLPPGPISNPSIQAITDVANPTPGPWLYWLTVNLDTGETRFTDSYEEHQANNREYKAWKEANRD